MPVSSLSLRAGLLANLAVLSFLTPSAFAQYQLEVTYTGDTFFDNFDFFTGPDANNGFVTYEDYCDAEVKGLISTDSLSGANYMGIDANTIITDPSLGGRAATRIISQQSFTHGLFIVDLNNMPGGVCGTNPGYYTIGNGEFNTISGTNDNTWDTMSLFTNGPYNAVAGDGTGLQETTACGTSSGCSTLNERSDDQSFGTNFNDNNGGIYATQWTSEGVNIWFWAYDSGDIIPDDVTNGSPDPTGWGPPVASFESGDASLDNVLSNGKLVFDTNFCGNAINSYWSQSPTCSALAPTCEEYVAGFPADFSQMYWGVNSINIYQLPKDMPTTPLPTPPSQSNACNANGASTSSTAISSTSAAVSSTSAAVSSTSAAISSTLAAISSTSIAIAASTGFPSPLGYSYYGCVEDISTRLMYSDHYITDPMSVEICAAYCAASDYIVFGVEYGRECYCANAFSATPTIVADSQCSMACSGNANEKCGGPMLLSVYANAPVPFPPAAISSSIVAAQSSAPLAAQTSVPLAAQTSAGLGAQSSLAAYTSVGFAAQSSIPAGISDAATSSISIFGASSSIYAAPSSVPIAAYTSVIPSTQSSAPLAAYTSMGFAAQSSIPAGISDAATSSISIFGASSSIYAAPSSVPIAAYTSVVPSAQSSAPLAAYTSVGFAAQSSISAGIFDAAPSSISIFGASSSIYAAPSSVPIAAYTSVVPSAQSSAPLAAYTSVVLAAASSLLTVATDATPSIIIGGAASSIYGVATSSSIYAAVSSTAAAASSAVTSLPAGGPDAAPSSLVLSGSGSSSVTSFITPASSSSISLTGASSDRGASSVFLPGSTLTKLVSSSTSTAVRATASPAVCNKWELVGCYSSDNGFATFWPVDMDSEDNTVESCTAICDEESAIYAGLYDGDCYCGDRHMGSATTLLDPSACSNTCPGDESETCGGDLKIPRRGAAKPKKRNVGQVPASEFFSIYAKTPCAASSSGPISVTSTIVTPSSIAVPVSSAKVAITTFATPVVSTAFAVSSAAGMGYTTETIYSTSTYTILSCAPTVTNCPLSSVTTQKYPVSTTIVPVTTPAPQFATSTIYETTVYTITSCAATVTDCPARMGQLTTEIISLYTTICPVTATALPTPPVISHGAPAPSEIFTTVIVTAYTDICPYGLTTMTTSQTQTLITGAPSPAIPMVTTTVTLGISTFTLTVPFTLPPPTAAALSTGGTVGNVASFGSALPTIAAATSMYVAQGPVVTSTVRVVPVPVQTGLYPVGNSSYSGMPSSVAATSGTGAAAAATGTGATPVPTTLMASESMGRVEWSSAAGMLVLVVGMFML